MPKCDTDKILNPDTGRCVSRTGKIGKELAQKKCGTDKIINPKTGQCVSRTGKIGKELIAKPKAAKAAEMKCPSDKIYNPDTGRCVSRTGKIGKELAQKMCGPDKIYNPDTWRCVSRTGKIGKGLVAGAKVGKAPKESKELKAAKVDKGGCVSGNTGKVIYKKALMLAKNYIEPKTGKTMVDPTGWWASEKFDGYRAIWNGKEFLTRANNKITVPKWFSDLMPPGVALDGELWMGRGGFRDCGLFRKKVACSAGWLKSKVSFKVFDIPSSNALFEERMKELETLIRNRCKCNKHSKLCPIQLAKQTKIKNITHLDKMFKSIVSQGGEGVMIRKPESRYESKRSNILLKYKVMHDTECKITGYKPGTGKYKGLLGSFECQLLKGSKVKFNVSGITDEIRYNYKKTHPVGTVITIQYNDTLKDGVPRHPRYFRKRGDYKF